MNNWKFRIFVQNIPPLCYDLTSQFRFGSISARTKEVQIRTEKGFGDEMVEEQYSTVLIDNGSTALTNRQLNKGLHLSPIAGYPITKLKTCGYIFRIRARGRLAYFRRMLGFWALFLKSRCGSKFDELQRQTCAAVASDRVF